MLNRSTNPAYAEASAGKPAETYSYLCVGDQGIEPCASRSQTERSTGELVPVFTLGMAKCAEGGTRTPTSG